MELKHKSLINKQNDRKMRLDKVDKFIKSILFFKVRLLSSKLVEFTRITAQVLHTKN